MKKKLKFFICMLLATVMSVAFFASCGENNENVTPGPTVSFREAAITMIVGDVLDAGISFTGGDNVRVSVSPEGIISYNDGSVTALKEGVATITAAIGEVTASMTVTVNAAPVQKVQVVIGEQTLEVAVGSKLSAPATPSKDKTDRYTYTFDGWYYGDKKWDFAVDTVQEAMTLTARFDETVRKYQVNLDGTFYQVEYGSKLTRPEDPVKESTSSTVYVFDKWVKYGTDEEWNFETDVVTGNVDLEPVFTAKEREYAYKYNLVSEQRTFFGKLYDLYDIKDEDFKVTVTYDGKEYSSPEVKDRAFEVVGVKGTYNVSIEWNGVVTEKVCRLQTNGETNVVIGKPVEIGGKAGELDSFGKNYTVNGDSITITGTAFAYIGGEEPTDVLYMEAKTAFKSGVGQMVGFMPAANHAELSGNGDKKLIFSYNYGNKLYYQEIAGWGTSGICEFGTIIDSEFAPLTDCKLAVARLGNDYYYFVNDKLFAHYKTETFGKGDFGFCNSGNSVDITFSNVQYTVKEDVVRDIIAKHDDDVKLIGDNKTYLGGSFTYPDGSTKKSFGSGWGLTSVNSGYMNATTYLYTSEEVGNVYYQEAEFTKEKGWVGFLVNTLDGEPQKNKGWYGYGVYCSGQLYLHEFKNGWSEGTLKTGVNCGTGDTFKLGVARLNDYYFVYINGTLVLQEKVTAYSTSDNSSPLPADNASGFGLFRGGNFSDEGKRITFSNYSYTTDPQEIKEIVGSVSTVEYGDKISMSQAGIKLENGDSLMPGVNVTVKFDVPEGKVIKKYSLTVNGNTVDVSLENNQIVFSPSVAGKYVASVEFTDKGTSSLNLSIKSLERTVNGKSYALYGMNIDWSKVKVSLLNVTTAKVSDFGVEGATKTISDLESGYYKISVSYNSNVYTEYLILEKGNTADYIGYVSAAYLGGTITIPNENGVQTTYKSFDNAGENATSGSNWSLVDGRRDTILVTNYTYAFQNQFSGTKYYVEGTFDTNNGIAFGTNFGGMLISHGAKNLSGTSDKKFEAAISGKSVIATYIPNNWSPLNTFVIANFADMDINYDLSAVRLGVVRDGTEYWFFVNDVYVGYYVLSEITNECGVGVTASASVNVTISNFNYSANNDLIEAYKAMAPARENKEIDVYLIAGQSNASGNTSVNLNNAAGVNPNYLYGFNNIWYAGNAGANWKHDVSFGLARVGLGEWATAMGAEVGMAEKLSTYYNPETGREAVFVKYAVGGTNLSDNVGGLNASDGNWCPPSYFKTHNKVNESLSGGLYTKFFQEFDEQWQVLKAMGYSPKVKGLFWMQGEADKGIPSTYLELFKLFAADMRQDLTEHSGQDCSEMPIFIGEISRTSGSAVAGTVTTNQNFIAMQKTIPQHVANTYVVEIGNFDINTLNNNGTSVAVGSDTWHWNWEDMLTIGNMVGDSILKNALGQK